MSFCHQKFEKVFRVDRAHRGRVVRNAMRSVEFEGRRGKCAILSINYSSSLVATINMFSSVSINRAMGLRNR